MSTTITPRTTVVTLLQGDDYDRIAELSAAVEQAATLAVTDGQRRLGDAPEVVDAAKAYDDFVAEAAERGVKVTLHALGRKAWGDLLKKHPVRQEESTDSEGVVTTVPNATDSAHGFNVETLGDELVPASVAPGMFKTNAERDNFLDNLSDGEFSRLYSAAVPLNQSAGADPKARLSSRLVLTSVETLPSPDRLG